MHLPRFAVSYVRYLLPFSPCALYCITLCLAFLIPTPATAELDALEAEALVRAQWFEGIPDERIEQLAPAAIDQLRSMLNKAALGEYHANIIDLLGRGGGAGSYEAVIQYAASTPRGQVDGSQFRAQMAIPLALGHLARSDHRALTLLLQRVNKPPAVRWHHNRLDASRVAHLLQLHALTGLALSGKSEARSTLKALANQQPLRKTGIAARQRQQQRSHAKEMLQLHQQIQRNAGEAPQ